MARLDVVVDREEGRGGPPELGGVAQEGLGLGGAHSLVAEAPGRFHVAPREGKRAPVRRYPGPDAPRLRQMQGAVALPPPRLVVHRYGSSISAGLLGETLLVRMLARLGLIRRNFPIQPYFGIVVLIVQPHMASERRAPMKRGVRVTS